MGDSSPFDGHHPDPRLTERWFSSVVFWFLMTVGLAGIVCLIARGEPPDADLHDTNFLNYMRSLYRKGFYFEMHATNDVGAAYIRSLHGLDLTR